MTRKELLDAAAQCVLHDRQDQYGGMEDCFGVIANFWSIYVGKKIYPHDVAAMMIMLKVARFRSNPRHLDSMVDCAGYAACGAECAQMSALQLSGGVFKLWGHKSKAEAQPEFKSGDRVLAKSPNTGAFIPAEYVQPHPNGCGHVVKNGGFGIFTVDLDAVMPAPKAEGCEDLVQKDAPQTPDELCQRIVDCNPATFRLRTPTGEELAEMAQEEPHG